MVIYRLTQLSWKAVVQLVISAIRFVTFAHISIRVAERLEPIRGMLAWSLPQTNQRLNASPVPDLCPHNWVNRHEFDTTARNALATLQWPVRHDSQSLHWCNNNCSSVFVHVQCTNTHLSPVPTHPDHVDSRRRKRETWNFVFLFSSLAYLPVENNLRFRAFTMYEK